MMGFTPGPWNRYGGRICADTEDGSRLIIATVYPVLGHVSIATRNENGRLMAAAPELLEAVLFVKDFLNKLEGGLDVDDPLRAMREKFHAPLHAKLDAALAAVAKDKGGTL